jgi:hypothetical protein
LDAFLLQVAAMKVGDPIDAHSDLGPVSSLQHRDKVRTFVFSSVAVSAGRISHCVAAVECCRWNRTLPWHGSWAGRLNVAATGRCCPSHSPMAPL